jgi:uncharacterized protein (TIGR03086 family)
MAGGPPATMITVVIPTKTTPILVSVAGCDRAGSVRIPGPIVRSAVRCCGERVELLDAHQRAMALFDRAVHQIHDDQWDGPTPCTEWSARAVVNHLVCEQFWVPHLMRGETIAQVGDRYQGDVLGAEPVATWEQAASHARAALKAPGVLERTVHLSYGDDSAVNYLWQLTGDLAVHAWDLATAIGTDPEIDDELATDLYAWSEPFMDQWRGLGLFAAPVAVPPDAGPTDRLVALYGRRP